MITARKTCFANPIHELRFADYCAQRNNLARGAYNRITKPIYDSIFCGGCQEYNRKNDENKRFFSAKSKRKEKNDKKVLTFSLCSDIIYRQKRKAHGHTMPEWRNWQTPGT